MTQHDQEALTALYKALDFLLCNDMDITSVNDAIKLIEDRTLKQLVGSRQS